MLHKNITTGDVHFIQNWQVADSAARVALSTTVTTNDIGKVALQQDNSSFYILQDVTTGSGNTWMPIGSGGGGGGGVAISGGTQLATSGTVKFANSNGITFGMSNSTQMTADLGSANFQQTSATSAITSNALNTSSPRINLSAGSTSNNMSAVTFSNSNGVSFGLNGSVVTASHNGLTTARASSDAVGLNTAKTNVTWTVNSSGISLDAGGYAGTGTTFNGTNASASMTMNSNGLRLDLSAAAGGGAAWSGGISGGNTSGDTGTIQVSSMVFAGGNNITLSGSTNGNSYTVTISGPNAGGAQTGISGIAASNTTYTSGSVTFRDTNGISWGTTTGQQIQITHDLQYTSNTSNITSNAVNTNAARIQGVIGSNTTYTSGSVGLRDLNGITWQSTTGQSFQITHDLQYTSNTSAITSNALNTSAARVQAIMLGTATNAATNQTSTLSGTVTFSNLNGASFYTTANGAVSGVALSYTVPTVTNSSFSVQDSATTINPVSRIAFSTGNNITATLSTAAGLATVGFSHNLAGTGTTLNGTNLGISATLNSTGLRLDINNTDDHYYAWELEGVNTAGTTGTSLTTKGAFYLSGGNNVTLSGNSNTIVISAGNGGGGGAAVGMSTIGNTSGNSRTLSSGTLVFAGTNNITLSQSTDANGNTLSISGPSGGGVGLSSGVVNNGLTYGSTGVVSDQVGFAAGAGIELSQSTSSQSATLSIAMQQALQFSPSWNTSPMVTNSSAGQSSLYFQAIDLPCPISASRIDFYLSFSGALSAGNSTGTCAVGLGYGIYTLSSDSLTLLKSYSAVVVSQSMTSNTAYRATIYSGVSNATSHSTTTTGLSTSNASTFQATSINGLRVVGLPIGSVLPQGRYWIGVSVQTTSGNAMTNNVSMLMVTGASIMPAIASFGMNSVATNASYPMLEKGFGTYSAQSAAWPNSIAYSTDHIRGAVAQTLIPFQINGRVYTTNQ